MSDQQPLPTEIDPISGARLERLAAVDPELVALLSEWVDMRLRLNGRERSHLMKLKARLPPAKPRDTGGKPAESRAA